MAFSLSPSVDVREFDLSLTIPNLPSAKTGMVLPADKGPCLAITAITSEADLVNKFGKPTKDNYKEWFNAWNFLQYASSLYVARPLPQVGGVPVENAALKFNAPGGVFDSVNNESLGDFYNEELAFGQIENQHTMVALDDLIFVNRAVTSTQDAAVATCSDPAYWNSPIANDVAAKGKIVFTAGVGDCVVDATLLGEGTPSNTSPIATRPVYPAGSTKIGVEDASFFAVGDTFIVGNKNIVVKDVDVVNNILTISPGLPVAVAQLKKLSIFFDFTAGPIPVGATTIPCLSTSGLVNGDKVVVYDDNTDQKMELTVAGLTPTSFSCAATTFTIEEDTAGYVVGSDSYLRSYDALYDSALVKTVQAGGSTVSTYIIGTGSVVTEELVTFNELFEFEPDWSNDEFVVVVLQKSNNKFGLAETFTGSYNETARDFSGRNMFMESVINSQSKLVYCLVKENGNKVDTAPQPLQKFASSALTVGDPVGTNDIIFAEDLFRDPEGFDINILIASKGNLNGMSEIAETRKDCVAIVCPYQETDYIGKSATDACAKLIEEFGVKSTMTGSRDFSRFGTYSAVYGNMKYQYDKFNDVNRWVGVAGDIAGLYAAMDADRDPWWAPAGLERGKIKNAIKLVINPNKQNRDDLYVNSINPILGIPGEGNAVVWGQKTATAKPSAFDRVNVRRLLITIEKAVATASRYGLFEFNDAFTRSRLFALIDPYLRTVQARRGVYDFLVVCDESNNPATVIDANALVIDVYLKPTKVAEFIQINMKVTRTDANFQEIVGQAP